MKAKIIIGANYGDEGKGTIVANYTKNTNGKVLNVLTNGGSQRAHSVCTLNGIHIYQHFGSGSEFGADSFFNKNYIINPMQFIKEYNKIYSILNERIIYRHCLCRWSTPFDMMANQIIETVRKNKRHGSCGLGIWETVLRYKSDNKFHKYSFTEFCNLSDIEKFTYLQKIRDEYYSQRLRNNFADFKNIWFNDGMIMHFIQDCKDMYNITVEIDSLPENYDEVIFENGQGLLLNDDPKNIRTTPSKTGIESVDLYDLKKFNDISLHYVTRPYITKHGYGEFKNEKQMKHISNDIQEDLNNPYNKWQGEFRYGTLNLMNLKNRIENDASKLKLNKRVILEVTHCDEMDRMLEFKNLFSDLKFRDKAII